TDLVSRVYLAHGIDLEVRDEDGRQPLVQGILFPFWHDKYDPPTWVWGTQSTLMFRRPLLTMILPDAPSQVQDFRACSDFYIVRLGQLIVGSFVFPGARGCYLPHRAHALCPTGVTPDRPPT